GPRARAGCAGVPRGLAGVRALGRTEAQRQHGGLVRRGRRAARGGAARSEVARDVGLHSAGEGRGRGGADQADGRCAVKLTRRERVAMELALAVLRHSVLFTTRTTDGGAEQLSQYAIREAGVALAVGFSGLVRPIVDTEAEWGRL